MANLSGEPHLYHIEFEDNLLVSEEVYSRLAFANPKLRYDFLVVVNEFLWHSTSFQSNCFGQLIYMHHMVLEQAFQ